MNRVSDIMGGVVLRDIRMALSNARRDKRDLTHLEVSGMLARAERYGVLEAAEKILAGR